MRIWNWKKCSGNTYDCWRPRWSNNKVQIRRPRVKSFCLTLLFPCRKLFFHLEISDRDPGKKFESLETPFLDPRFFNLENRASKLDPRFSKTSRIALLACFIKTNVDAKVNKC